MDGCTSSVTEKLAEQQLSSVLDPIHKLLAEDGSAENVSGGTKITSGQVMKYKLMDEAEEEIGQTQYETEPGSTKENSPDEKGLADFVTRPIKPNKDAIQNEKSMSDDVLGTKGGRSDAGHSYNRRRPITKTTSVQKETSTCHNVQRHDDLTGHGNQNTHENAETSQTRVPHKNEDAFSNYW